MVRVKTQHAGPAQTNICENSPKTGNDREPELDKFLPGREDAAQDLAEDPLTM